VNGDLPPPLTNFEGVPAPSTGLIVRFNGTDWVDAAGRPWTAFQTFTLPDWDVFALDATTSPPRRTAVYSGVGTVNFNMVTNPASGNLYVSNLNARNDVRFEGPGQFGGSTVRGHFAENRITVIDESGVHPRHLNKHIDYDVFPGTPRENAKSLAFPLQMAVSADGSKLYSVAFGSSKVAVFDVKALENDTFVPNRDDQIELSGGGPCGLVLDEGRNKLYVLTRFDDSLVTVDLTTRTEQARVPLYNPEPPSLVNGRRFLYDARYTSSHGDSACASCHIFGDQDGLAWDLGNPDGAVLQNPNPFVFDPVGDTSFHPMKGPMTTQSLRGLANQGRCIGAATAPAVPCPGAIRSMRRLRSKRSTSLLKACSVARLRSRMRRCTRLLISRCSSLIPPIRSVRWTTRSLPRSSAAAITSSTSCPDRGAHVRVAIRSSRHSASSAPRACLRKRSPICR
jgi:hypothetical protein